MLNPFAAVVRTVRRLVRMRRLEHKHGFPCNLCGAKTFDEAGNLKDAMATKLAVGVGEAAVGLARAVRAAR